jgi:type IV secretory pathway TrbD component
LVAKVYQSLARPKLHAGGEWYVVGGIGMFCIFLMLAAIASHRWWPAIFAVIVYKPAMWLARRAAKHDWQYLLVYWQSLQDRQRPILEPHGFAGTRDSKPPEIWRKPSRWVK